MSAYPLNYAIRNTNGQLSGNLGWLFTMYWLHSDSLLRCYPGNELLKTETGMKSDATLTKHREKLIEMKALIVVPYEKRITEKEKSLHQRKYVYQITGIMQLEDGSIIPTVHINKPEEFNTHVSILQDLGFDVSLLFKAYSEFANTSDKSKPSISEVLNPQKLKLSKNEGEVVHKKLLSSTGEEKTSPDPEPLVSQIDDDFKAKMNVLDRAGVLSSSSDYRSFKETAGDYTLDQWTRGVKRLIERRNGDGRHKGYGYLKTIMPDIEAEDKQAKLAQKPSVTYFVEGEIKRPSVTDGMINFDKSMIEQEGA